MADPNKAQAIAGIRKRSIKKYGAGKMQSAKNLNATYERTHARGGIGKPATGKPGKGTQASGSAIQRKRPPGPNTIRPKGKGYGTNPVRRTTMVREQNSRVPGGMELTKRPPASATEGGVKGGGRFVKRGDPYASGKAAYAASHPARDINGNLKKVGSKRPNPVSPWASANAATRPPGVSKSGASKPGGPIYREPPLRPKARTASAPQRPTTRPNQRALPRPNQRAAMQPPQTHVSIQVSHGAPIGSPAVGTARTAPSRIPRPAKSPMGSTVAPGTARKPKTSRPVAPKRGV